MADPLIVVDWGYESAVLIALLVALVCAALLVAYGTVPERRLESGLRPVEGTLAEIEFHLDTARAKRDSLDLAAKALWLVEVLMGALLTTELLEVFDFSTQDMAVMGLAVLLAGLLRKEIRPEDRLRTATDRVDRLRRLFDTHHRQYHDHLESRRWSWAASLPSDPEERERWAAELRAQQLDVERRLAEDASEALAAFRATELEPDLDRRRERTRRLVRFREELERGAEARQTERSASPRTRRWLAWMGEWIRRSGSRLRSGLAAIRSRTATPGAS